MFIALIFFFNTAMGAIPEEGAPAKTLDQQRLYHVNGISFIKPDGYDHEERENGFKLVQSGSFRYNHTIIINRVKKPIDLTAAKQRTLPNGEASYAIRTFDEGMGGPEFKLEVNLQHQSGLVYIESFQQREWGEPTFDFTWDVIKTIQLK